MAKTTALLDPKLGPLTLDLLTRDVRVWQRRKGHRFSSDDVVTTLVAWRERPEAKRLLDLGCGLGSVLLHLAWKMPTLVAAGIEAQAESYELLRRNVERSGYADRVTIRHGDLRDTNRLDELGSGFDLVTGTPPYFPKGTALDADDKQRTFARMENRGGVEAYMRAASRVVTDDGTVVLCGDHEADARVMAAQEACGLYVRARTDVTPKEGKPVLFSVWVLGRAAGSTPIATTGMTLRDRAGRPAEGARLVREFGGFDPLDAAPAM
jgi:tRNA1(Val) A37 N6-methylase TrmN6